MAQQQLSFELILPPSDAAEAQAIVAQIARDGSGHAAVEQRKESARGQYAPTALPIIAIAVAGVITVLGIQAVLCNLKCGSVLDLRKGKVVARKECDGIQRGVTVVVRDDGVSVVKCDTVADVIKSVAGALGGGDKKADDQKG